MSRDYLLVSPVRDEAEYAHRTLDSVLRQTVLPAKWIIVDDGSTDGTAEIVADYARRAPFIELVRRVDRGRRSVGPGVVDTFYAGLAQVPDLARYPYLCKLDMDLELPDGYFEGLLRRMEAEPRLGTCSGKPYYPAAGNVANTMDGELVAEVCGDEMSVGMTKFYRTACFQQIGGFVREVMWDGIDCHQCRRRGWIAASVDDPSLRFLHLRPMGSSHKGVLTGRWRHGYGQYFLGTGAAYLFASALFRLRTAPYVVGSLAIVGGYLESLVRRRPRFGDADFRRFLRDYQWRCLLWGKQRATARLNERQAAAWRPDPPP